MEPTQEPRPHNDSPGPDAPPDGAHDHDYDLATPQTITQDRAQGTSNNAQDNHGNPKANATPPETTASQKQYPLDEEGGDLARALELSYEDMANDRKRQGKKRAHATAHEPAQNYSDRGPTPESDTSDEEHSSKLRTTMAASREPPTAHKEPTPGAASSVNFERTQSPPQSGRLPTTAR